MLRLHAEQVVVLAMPGSPAADAADERGLAALAVLRAMGLPTLVGLVQEPNNSLREKSAAKKRGRALLDREARVRFAGPSMGLPLQLCIAKAVHGCCLAELLQSCMTPIMRDPDLPQSVLQCRTA